MKSLGNMSQGEFDNLTFAAGLLTFLMAIVAVIAYAIIA